MPAARTRACIATRLCSFQSICCPCVELRCLFFSPSPQLSSQLSALPWLLGCAFRLSLLPPLSQPCRDEQGQGWLIHHYQSLWYNPGGTCNPCNSGGTWNKTWLPNIHWLLGIRLVNVAKVTFFSIHLSYGFGESIKRPAFPERVTNIVGDAAALQGSLSLTTPNL